MAAPVEACDSFVFINACLSFFIYFFCMVTNSTNKNRISVYSKSQRSPQKVNSLVYKDYTLVEYEDGTKSYVSPEEKAQLVLKGSLKSSKLTLENEKIREADKDSESESDSGYEIPMAREKPKSCDNLDKIPKTDMKKNSSFPFFDGEISPGDNGRINLPPYIVPLETSLTFPMTKQKRKNKKRKSKNADAEDTDKSLESSSSPDEVDAKKRFSLKDPFWTKKTSGDADESPEDAEVRKITENNELKKFSMKPAKGILDGETERNTEHLKSEVVESESKTEDNGELEEPVEIFPEDLGAKEDERITRFSYGVSLPKFPDELLKVKERRPKNKRFDPNPLKKMFAFKSVKKLENQESACSTANGMHQQVEPQGEEIRGRYSDAALSQIESDTESADHGSADKSSVSKLTSEKQPKKFVSGLLGSFRKGRNKDKMSDNDQGKNSLSFEIAIKEQEEDIGHTDVTRGEGIVYAELDMGKSPSGLMTRRDDEKTEYAEIIYPGTKPVAQRSIEDLRKSRENLTSSRENLTEVDEAFSTITEGKKEAAV